jgi:hypothetical protein
MYSIHPGLVLQVHGNHLHRGLRRVHPVCHNVVRHKRIHISRHVKLPAAIVDLGQASNPDQQLLRRHLSFSPASLNIELLLNAELLPRLLLLRILIRDLRARIFQCRCRLCSGIECADGSAIHYPTCDANVERHSVVR